MSNMGETMTVKLADIGKGTVKHKWKALSGSSLIGTIAVLGWLGINPLDFIVGNASVFTDYKEKQDVQVESLEDDMDWLRESHNSLRREISHLDHYVVSQNIIARKLLDADIINMDTYDMIYHAVEHRRDSL